MARGLKVAIVGAGLMGNWHAHAARRVGATVIGVIDHDKEAAAALAARYNGAEVFSTIREVAERFAPTVAHICTPLSAHMENALEAFDAGIHVICEKPLTSAASETKSIQAAARAHGLMLCPVHQFPYQVGWQEAIRTLDSVGNLRRVVFDFCSAGAETSSQAAPDSVLADILPHPLSLAKSLFPRASLDRLPWHSIAPDAGELLTQTVIEGVAVAICISMSGRPTRCEAELVGTRGSLFVDFFHGYSVFHRGHVSKTRKILNPYIHSVQTLVGASGNLLRRAVRRESAYPGLASLFDAFYRSLSDGQRLVSDEVVLEIAEARERLVDSYD